jgi:outer membrane protein assembly factor BamA
MSKRIICYCLSAIFFYSAILAQGTASQINLHVTDTLIKKAVDSNALINVSAIILRGNKKTKDYIILRELSFKTGDSIRAGELFGKMNAAKELIYNTNLFSIVEITPILTSAYDLTVNISVIERWYIYPAPQFKLIDRDFNDWWKTYHADLQRVTYGLKYTQYNVSGNADQLNIYLLNGYSKNFTTVYNAPYIDKKLKKGFSVAVAFSQIKEYPYKTSYNNKLFQFKSNRSERQVFFISGTFRIRKGFYSKHFFTIQYSRVKVDDSVIQSKYNPEYFNIAKNIVSYPDISYGYQYVNTDNINYPQKGKIFTLGINKRGLGVSGGVNMLSFDISYRKYFPHKYGFFSSLTMMGKLKLPFKQPYINQRALGYGDFYLSGMEYYVIDGVMAGVAKYNLNKKLFSFKIPVPFKIKSLPYIPLSFFGKVYGEGGFAYNKPELDTRLNNIFLYSGGFGLDFLSLYDLRLSLEFSFNQLGEKGLFLHARSLL